MDLSTADAPPEIRRKCRSALQGGQDELSCLQFLTRMATEQSRNCYQVFVASGNEPNILHLLVDRLGTASADMRTHILSCLNAFDMPEYLLPAFLTSLESSSWQVRMQAILALQSLHNFTPQQKQILQDALTGILDRDSSDLVKQASKQTLVLWEEFASYYNGGGSDNNNGGNGAGATASSTNNSGYHDVNIMMGGGGQAQVGVSNGTGGLLNAGDHGVGDLTSNSMGGAVPHGQIMKMDTSSTDHLSPPGWAIGGDPLQISRSSTHVDSSFDGSSDSLRSSLIGGGGSQHQNQLTVGGSSSSTAPLAGLSNSSTNSPYFRVPADFVSRITRNDSNMQLLEDVHGVILGASPVGYDPMTEECVSLLNVNVLKKFMESVLSQTHFKVTLTTLYIIGDLVAPVASNNVDQATALQESALKVLPSILHRIFDKLGDTKFVIRQTTCKLVTKIIGAMDLDMNSDLLQLVYLLFEEFENSSGGKSEALVTVLTTVLIVSPRAGSQDMANLISTRLQKWFEKTKDERVAILLGEGLAVTSRKLGIVGPQEAYSHASEKYTSILRSQVSRSRDAMLPAVNEEGLLEYAPEIQTALEGTGSSLLGGFYSSDNIFGSNAYNMSKVRKMPAPILKTDDRMSCVSGSTNSSRKPRVTFSDVGDEKHSSSRSSASASTSGSLSCGVSSAASSASNSTSGVETGGVHGSGVGDLTKTFLSLKGEHGGSKLAAAASLHLSSSPSKNFGAPEHNIHHSHTSTNSMSSGGGMNLNANSLADEVQNYLSSDFKQYNNPKQYNSQHGGHHPSSSSTGGGATPSGFHNDMANSSLGYHLQQRHAAGRSQQGFHQAPGGGQQHNGHGGGNAASMHQLNHTTGGSSGAMMRSHSYSTTSNTGTGGPHGHHPSNINMAGGPPGSGGGMPMSGGLGNVGPTSSSSTTNGAFNMLPHHQTLGGFQNPAGPHVVSNGLYGSHSSTAFNIDTFQHSNHNHMNLAGSWSMNNTGPGGAGTINGMHGGPSLGDQQDFKDRLRLLKNRVRHDHRGMLRSEGSMQPSTSSMHNLDQRSVMSAGEAIPWGLGVISLSKVDHNFSNSIASSLQQHRSGGTRRALARSRSTASDTGVGTSCAGSASGAGVGSKRSGLDVTHRRWPRANAGVVAS